MKKIPLTKGYTAIVDDEDYSYLSQFKWCFSNGSAVRAKKNGFIYMHRIIAQAPLNKEVDHVNGSRLDNRKENLRIATHQENMCNRKKHANNTSGFKGITWDKSRDKFSAQIQVFGKKVNLGRFVNIKDAIEAYKSASIKYFGVFIRQESHAA